MKNQSAKSLFRLNIQLFAEDPKPGDPVPNPEPPDPDKNLIETIEKLKKGSVPIETYKKLEDQNKKLLDAVLNEGHTPGDETPPQKSSIKDLREELYGSKRKPMTNLEYWTKTLELRELLMEQGETDPMAPTGKKIQATFMDCQRAESIASNMKKLVKEANGDPASFNSILRREGLDV